MIGVGKQTSETIYTIPVALNDNDIKNLVAEYANNVLPETVETLVSKLVNVTHSSGNNT